MTGYGQVEPKETSQLSQNNLGLQIADRLKDKHLACEEMTDIILAGSEGLLNNLIFLIHHMEQFPSAMDALRAELDHFSQSSPHGRQTWKDPRLLQLEYLVGHMRRGRGAC